MTRRTRFMCLLVALGLITLAGALVTVVTYTVAYYPEHTTIAVTFGVAGFVLTGFGIGGMLHEAVADV